VTLFEQFAAFCSADVGLLAVLPAILSLIQILAEKAGTQPNISVDGPIDGHKPAM